MNKGYKVRRYGHDRRHQRKAHMLRIALLAVLVIGACVAGWYLFEPVSEWLSEKAAEREQHRIEQEQQQQQGNANQPSGEGEGENNPESSLPVRETDFPKSSTTLETALLYDLDALEDKLATLAAEGYTGVIFDLKNDDGLVLYQSKLQAVTSNERQTAERYDLAAVIKAAKEVGLTPIGRLVAFQDRTATRSLHEATVKFNYTTTNWIDNDASAGGKSWLNANHPKAQQYILDLMQEACKAGVEHILLEGVQFPTGYSLNLATYAEQGVTVDKSAVLAAFIDKAADQMVLNGGTLHTVLYLSDLMDSSVRLGDNPQAVLEAAPAVIKLTPEQFASRKYPIALNFSASLKTALTTVLVDAGNLSIAAEVQGYAPTEALWPHETRFGNLQITEQIKVAEDAGITTLIVDTVR